MSDNTPNTVAYNVTYKVWEGGVLDTTHQTTRVVIGATSNHVTTFADIPKIIAVSRGLQASDVLVTFLDCVLIVDAAGNRV